MLGDRRLQLYGHGRLWRAYRALGESEAAAIELGRAAELLEGADEVSAELDEVRREVAATARRPQERRTRAPRNPVSKSVN
jgi:hypothetical protein